ncbi:MAG: lytic transglycosylase domain-containing protein, partial [Gammaproteobacteria bacterium]|nr:lytic transglycosylase domain-containing protein [Gammaproteobacteria bacterium]
MRRVKPVLLLFFLAVLQPSLSAAAKGDADPNAAAAWKNYMRKDTTVAPAYRFPHASCFKAATATYGLPETLLLAVARGESDFESNARSRANAHGVMQIQWPGTAKHLGVYRLSDLYDPCTNIDAGARYLKELVTEYNGNLHLALAAYNYGPSRIPRNAVDIPDGASWYSGYIFRHLNYILGNRSNRRTPGEHLYSELGRTTLVSFGEPYRAAAFVSGIEQ